MQRNNKPKSKRIDREISRLLAGDRPARPSRPKKPKAVVVEGFHVAEQAEVQAQPVVPVINYVTAARFANPTDIEAADTLLDIAQPMDLSPDEVPVEEVPAMAMPSHGSFSLERGKAESLVDIAHGNVEVVEALQEIIEPQKEAQPEAQPEAPKPVEQQSVAPTYVPTLPALNEAQGEDLEINAHEIDDLYADLDFSLWKQEVHFDPVAVAIVDEQIRLMKIEEEKLAEEARQAEAAMEAQRKQDEQKKQLEMYWQAEAARAAAEARQAFRVAVRQLEEKSFEHPCDFALPANYDRDAERRYIAGVEAAPAPSMVSTSQQGLFKTTEEETIFTMAEEGLLRSLKKLIDKPNFSSLVNSHNENNETPIYLAIKNGHTSVVKFLSPHCTTACLNHKADSGLSALELVNLEHSGIKNLSAMRKAF